MNRSRVALVALVLVSLGYAEARAEDHQYVGVKKCRSCHKKELIGDQYGVWQDGPHAKAFETLKGDEALRIAKEKGLVTSPHETKECLKCHVTAYGIESSHIKYRMQESDGVQCESCHGPGSDYRSKRSHAVSHEKAIADGMWEAGKDEKICQNCHNDESPTWDPSKFTLADGTTVAFDFEQAKERIEHPIPEEVKGKVLEIQKQRRERGEEEEEED